MIIKFSETNIIILTLIYDEIFVKDIFEKRLINAVNTVVLLNEC
jgi:hypothetical protein